ncbi:MAG TPA: hypothetical protein PLV25_07950, partial [Opitutales bacterium]|nr:hypothetical protein [Opitutales bacterium]
MLAALQPEERISLLEAPLVERLDKYGAYAGLNQGQSLEHVALVAGLEVKPLWDVHPEPTSLIPLRLIHEYQCLPIADDEAAESLGANALRLVTVWPPTPAMSAWIYALTGRQPIWY